MDTWLQYVAIGTGLVIASLGPYVSNTSAFWKRTYYGAILALGISSCVLAYLQASERDRMQIASLKDREVMQQKLDKALEQNQRLETQNRDLDAQLVAIRKKFGVSAQFDRSISVDLQTKFGAEATVEKGAGQAAPETR